MFSLGADDDDLDFTPSNGAGLMSLFGKTSSSSPGGKSDSLKFSAPKQPKPEPKADSGGGGASGKLDVFLMLLVHILFPSFAHVQLMLLFINTI